MKKILLLFVVGLLFVFGFGCDENKSADQIIQEKQAKSMRESVSQIGIPAIKNFQERHGLINVRVRYP